MYSMLCDILYTVYIRVLCSVFVLFNANVSLLCSYRNLFPENIVQACFQQVGTVQKLMPKALAIPGKSSMTTVSPLDNVTSLITTVANVITTTSGNLSNVTTGPEMEIIRSIEYKYNMNVLG